MGSKTQRVPVQVRGNQSYSSGADFRVAFNDISPVPGAKHTYMRALEFAVDAVFSKSNAGTSSLPAVIAHRVFERLTLQVPGNGHTFLDLPQQAGVALYYYRWAMTGKRPTPVSALTIPATGSTLTARLKIVIPFQFPGGIEPDDFNVALDDLREAQLVGSWCSGDAGGAFDAGANDELITSATTIRAVTAVLVGRDEYRVPPPWTIGTIEQNGIEDHIPVSDCKLHLLAEIPVHANGLTENFITDAERDLVTLRINERTPVDRIDARELVSAWDYIHAQTNDDRQGDHEGDATRFVPITFGDRRRRKGTHSPTVEGGQPRLRVTGTDATPRLLYMIGGANKIQGIFAQVRKSGVRVPADFAKSPGVYLEPKTFAKTSVGKGLDGGIQVVPAKLNPLGDKKSA